MKFIVLSALIAIALANQNNQDPPAQLTASPSPDCTGTVANCRVCSSTTVCTACDTGFAMTDNASGVIQSCTVCTDATCLDCGVPDTVTTANVNTAQPTVCVRCPASSALDSPTTAGTTECTVNTDIDNCAYQTNARCYSCLTGFFLNAAMTTCTGCTAGCDTCTASTAAACTACSLGFYLASGTCTACTTIDVNATACTSATVITACTSNTHWAYTYVAGDESSPGVAATVGNTVCADIATKCAWSTNLMSIAAIMVAFLTTLF